jgi:hypothetical protein
MSSAIDPLDPAFRMCIGDDLVWVGRQQPNYSLWYFAAGDALDTYVLLISPSLTDWLAGSVIQNTDRVWCGVLSLMAQKRIQDMEQSVVRVLVDGCSKGLRATATTTVAACIELLLRKLCKDSLGMLAKCYDQWSVLVLLLTVSHWYRSLQVQSPMNCSKRPRRNTLPIGCMPKHRTIHTFC